MEQLYVPALKAGVIERVQEILKVLNHSLVQWELYLTAVCRYLSQRSLYHILYQTQLYMRVYTVCVSLSVCVCVCVCFGVYMRVHSVCAINERSLYLSYRTSFEQA